MYDKSLIIEILIQILNSSKTVAQRFEVIDNVKELHLLIGVRPRINANKRRWVYRIDTIYCRRICGSRKRVL